MRPTTMAKARKSLMRIDNATAGIDGYEEIHGGIVKLLEDARRAVARSVNAQITASYWEIGRRIVDYEQAGAAAPLMAKYSSSG